MTKVIAISGSLRATRTTRSSFGTQPSSSATTSRIEILGELRTSPSDDEDDDRDGAPAGRGRFARGLRGRRRRLHLHARVQHAPVPGQLQDAARLGLAASRPRTRCRNKPAAVVSAPRRGTFGAVWAAEPSCARCSAAIRRPRRRRRGGRGPRAIAIRRRRYAGGRRPARAARRGRRRARLAVAETASARTHRGVTPRKEGRT